MEVSIGHWKTLPMLASFIRRFRRSVILFTDNSNEIKVEALNIPKFICVLLPWFGRYLGEIYGVGLSFFCGIYC